MVNDNRRAEQEGAEGGGRRMKGGGWRGHPGERAWRIQHRPPLLAAISQTRKTFTTWFMAASGE